VSHGHKEPSLALEREHKQAQFELLRQNELRLGRAATHQEGLTLTAAFACERAESVGTELDDLYSDFADDKPSEFRKFVEEIVERERKKDLEFVTYCSEKGDCPESGKSWDDLRHAFDNHILKIRDEWWVRLESHPLASVVEAPGYAEESGTSEFTHGDGYRSVRKHGKLFNLTAEQARVIQILHENWKRGTPDIGKDYLLEELEGGKRLRDLFKRKPEAQKELITTGYTEGTYRLNIEHNS